MPSSGPLTSAVADPQLRSFSPADQARILADAHATQFGPSDAQMGVPTAEGGLPPGGSWMPPENGGATGGGTWTPDAVTPSVPGDLASRQIPPNLQPQTTVPQMGSAMAAGAWKGIQESPVLGTMVLQPAQRNVSAMAAPPPVNHTWNPYGPTDTPEDQTLEAVNQAGSLVRGLTYGPLADAYKAGLDLAGGNAITPGQPMGFPGSDQGAGEVLRQSLPAAVGETAGMTFLDPAATALFHGASEVVPHLPQMARDVAGAIPDLPGVPDVMPPALAKIQLAKARALADAHAEVYPDSVAPGAGNLDPVHPAAGPGAMPDWSDQAHTQIQQASDWAAGVDQHDTQPWSGIDQTDHGAELTPDPGNLDTVHPDLGRQALPAADDPAPTPGVLQRLMSDETGSSDLPGVMRDFRLLQQIRQATHAEATLRAAGDTTRADIMLNRIQSLRGDNDPGNPDTQTYPNTVNPDDHMNFDKMSVLDGPQTEATRQLVSDTVAAMVNNHKTPRSGADLAVKAGYITDGHIDNLVRQGYQADHPLSADEYMAVQNRLADLIPRIVELKQESGGPTFTGDLAYARKQLSDAEDSTKGLIGLLSPSRSDKGRALAYLKEQAKQGFNSDYWMSRATRRAGGELSGGQVSDLATILDRGRVADEAGRASAAEAEGHRARAEALEADAPDEAEAATEPAEHPMDAIMREMGERKWEPPTHQESPVRPEREPTPEKVGEITIRKPRSPSDIAAKIRADGTARIERNRGVTFTSALGVGHADLAYGHIQVLAADMIDGAVSFAYWAHEMHDQYGDGIVSHLPKIWTEAEKVATQALKGREPKGRRPVLEEPKPAPKSTQLRDIVGRERARADSATVKGAERAARDDARTRAADALKEKRAAQAAADAEDKAATKASLDASDAVKTRQDSLARIVGEARDAVGKDAERAQAQLEQAHIDLGNAMGKAREAAAKARAKADTLAQAAEAARAAKVADAAAQAEGRAADRAAQADTRAQERDARDLGNAMGQGRANAERDRAKADTADQTAAARAADKAAKAQAATEARAAEKAARDDVRKHAATVRKVNIDLARYMARVKKDSGWHGASEAIRAGLISSPRTLGKVSLSHVVHITMEELAHTMAAGIDKAISLKTKQRTTLAPGLRDIPGAMTEAATRGVRESWEIMKDGMTHDEMANLQIPHELVSKYPWLNNYVNGIYRTHGAVYHPFKVYAFTRSLQEQAKLMALQDPTTNVHDLMANPTAEMVAEATAAGEFITFSEANRLSEGIGKLKSNLPDAGKFAFDRLAPFTHVPTNILSRVLDYSTVGVGAMAGGPVGAVAAAGIRIGPAIYRAIKAGGLSAADQRIIAGALGRGLVGAPMIYLGYKLGLVGYVTGTFDRASSAAMKMANRSFDSVKICGHWVKTDSLSPWGNLLVMGATMARPSNDRWAGLQVAADTVLDAPFMQGVQQMHDLRETHNPYPFVGSMAGSLVPTALSDVASAMDGSARQTSRGDFGAIPDAIKARIPGWRNTLPAQETALGVSVPNGSVPEGPLHGINAFGPLAGRPDLSDRDRVTREFTQSGVAPPAVPPSVPFEKSHVPITEAERAAIQHDAGMRTHAMAQDYIDNNADYKAADADTKALYLKRIAAFSQGDAVHAFIAANEDSLAARKPGADAAHANQQAQHRIAVTP